jgi:hypothetical protein
MSTSTRGDPPLLTIFILGSCAMALIVGVAGAVIAISIQTFDNAETRKQVEGCRLAAKASGKTCRLIPNSTCYIPAEWSAAEANPTEVICSVAPLPGGQSY